MAEMKKKDAEAKEIISAINFPAVYFCPEWKDNKIK